ncbi:peptide chain release factor N(5)-glutamine methyltransferase [Thiotrichales bacterium 19S3-7]|nr:peptide chain release factor N(5)-glutamine methyltransferase [Thiotrichales bacterium 19S3-7]MCF6801673.1 peptide chain release factor N(5)-glutamine methyltransferase [Thiotrichales bacterium 19S3-11]
MQIKDVIHYWIKPFKTVSQSPFLDLEILIGFVINKERTFIKAHPEWVLTNSELSQLESLVNRALQGEPIAYLIGKQAFWDFDLYVDSSVLIPRSDSEILVEAVLEYYPDHLAEKTLIDLGCGSGALALAIAKERHNFSVFASDNSFNALAITQKNIQHLKIENVGLFASKWFNAIKVANYFDIIISNPPYIDRADPMLECHVKKYEPSNALFSKNNGLEDLFAIIDQSKKYLKPGGSIFLEHGYLQGKFVRDRLISETFCHVKTISDLNGLERVSFGIK